VANTLALFWNEASLLAKPFGVGFIDWVDRAALQTNASYQFRGAHV